MNQLPTEVISLIHHVKLNESGWWEKAFQGMICSLVGSNGNAAKSTWSKVNKAKVEVLIKNKLMQKEGLESINIAKKNGSWTILDEVEELIIPKDLELALTKITNGMNCFLGLSKTVKKAMLHRLVFAKREETRQKIIKEIGELAGKKQKSKQF